jgi:CDP-glycerol glycerophosphotransferase (TagB/SpsB family)
MVSARARTLLDAVRELDTRWQRRRAPDERHVLIDARTSMEYAMMAPVHRRLQQDPRVRVYLTSSERPGGMSAIYREAGSGPLLFPRRAMRMKFDVCLAADFIWATLPRGTRRVQMFHGVAGKWGHIYDRPAASMRQWDRLFFINRRRLQNFIASGAIAADSPAIRLVGMPKADCLVDGTLRRDEVLARHGIDPSARTVLYAPTWTRFSSLNAMGEAVVSRLVDAGYMVLVKLHDNSLDMAHENSGGVDWAARLEPILQRGGGRLVRDGNAAPWLVASDVLVSDHSSIGFEYLLLDRPLIRIEMPELITGAHVPAEYVELMAEAATSVRDAAGVLQAVDAAFREPARASERRRTVARELFFDPGRATDRAVAEIYALMEFAWPAHLEPTDARLVS